MTKPEIDYLSKLIEEGMKELSANSLSVETMNLALGYLFKMPEYDDRIITQILAKLKELGWDVSPQESRLDFLRNGIRHSINQINTIMNQNHHISSKR